MNEKTAAKVNALLEDVFADGIKEGRELERADIVRSLSGEARSQRQRAPRTPAIVAAAPPPPVSSVALATSVGEALQQLRADNPDGVFPDTITDYVKQHHSNGGTTPSSRDIRQALRKMMLSGQARRVQRGRYLPVDTAPPPGTLFHSAPSAA